MHMLLQLFLLFISTFLGTPEQAQATACILVPEYPYKSPESAAVFYVDADCTKRPFKNEFIYKTYFSSWSSVRVTTAERLHQVPNHELGFMPLGPKYEPKYGALVKIVTDPKVYLLINNKKYWITSETVFNGLNYKWNWIEDIDKRLLDKYLSGGEITDMSHHVDGTIIKYAGDASVYVLTNGEKQHIPNEEAFDSLGYRADRIVTIPKTEVYTDSETEATPVVVDNNRVRLAQSDFTYVGAFRLPKNINGSSRFGYGGGAMAFNPKGSLYIAGHEHDQLVAEVNIPTPVDQRGPGVTALNTAQFLHGFVDITEGLGPSMDSGNGWRLDGLAYLDRVGAQSTGKIYWTARTYYNVDTSDDLSHGMSDANLSALHAKGMWRLGSFHGMETGGYIFPVPTYFADKYLGGKRLISGLFTQQGVSATSQGPAFFAYGPWLDDSQNSGIPNGTRLTAQLLLHYPYKPIFVGPGQEPVSNFPGHQVPDRWDAAAWVSTPEKHAVVVVGRRAMGDTYYGDARPTDCNIYKGYHGEPYEPRILLYDPEDLALSAQGKKDPTTIVPYLEWDPREFFVPTCEWELTGVVYDEEQRLVYILHTNADTVDGEPTPLIYVFRIK